MNLHILDQVSYAGKSQGAKALDILLTPARVALGGRKITLRRVDSAPVISKTCGLGLRLIAGIGAAVFLPAMLLGLGLKFLLTYQSGAKQLARHTATNAGGSAPEDGDETEIFPLTEVQQSLKGEITAVQKFESKLPKRPEPGSWRAFGVKKLGEKDESFDKFACSATTQTDDPENPPIVVLQVLGTLGAVDRQILELAAKWLAVLHQIEVKIADNDLTFEKLQELGFSNPKSRKSAYGTQYRTDDLLNTLNAFQPHYKKCGKKVYVIGFINHDLYASGGNNFVYGIACPDGPGLFSNARFGNPAKNFDRCLARTIKTFTHEFAHMRHLPHCHSYACNVGGSINMEEADNAPFLFCAKDMAKICYLTDSKLVDHYKRVRAFMQTFNQTYGVHLDLAKELTFLDKAIAAIDNNNFN